MSTDEVVVRDDNDGIMDRISRQTFVSKNIGDGWLDTIDEVDGKRRGRENIGREGNIGTDLANRQWRLRDKSGKFRAARRTGRLHGGS